MKIKNFIVAAVFVAVIFAVGCAPKITVKDSGTAASSLTIEISQDEYNRYMQMAKEGVSSEERAEGTFWSSVYLKNIGKKEQSIKYLEHNEKYYPDTIWGYISIIKLAELCAEKKDTSCFFEKNKKLNSGKKQFPQFSAQINESQKKYLSGLGYEELKKVYASHYDRDIDAYALYYIIKADIASGSMNEFMSHARAFLMEYRDNEFYPEVNAEFKKSGKFEPVNSNKIGVIIPLQGKAMEIGQGIKNGIELALSEFNENRKDDEKVSFVYIDENLEDAALSKAIADAAEKENVIAFLGPLFSKTVKKILPVISSYNAVLFSSTAAQPDLPGVSEYFFRNCGTVKGQAYAMGRYAAQIAGKKRIATVYPENLLGKTLNGFFTEKARSLGAEIFREIAYDQDKNDMQEYILQLGGINTMLIKEKRAEEKRVLSEEMKKAGERIKQKIYSYMNLAVPEGTPKENIPKAETVILRFTPRGSLVKKYEIDIDMTKQLSYALAKDQQINVMKQAATDAAMSETGVTPEDMDREVALDIARGTRSDILVWGRVVEDKYNTTYAYFRPEVEVDKKGQTTVTYAIDDSHYFYFNVIITVFAVADERIIDEISIRYKRLKEPGLNPFGLDAVYLVVPDRKMALVLDQLKFYDLNCPVFAAVPENSKYLLSFPESVAGLVYPLEYFDNDPSEKVKEFSAKFKERYAGIPGVIEANAYDLMKLTSSILDTGVNSRESFKDMLKAVRNYEGVAGTLSFDSLGDSVKSYYIVQAQTDGTEKELGRVSGE